MIKQTLFKPTMLKQALMTAGLVLVSSSAFADFIGCWPTTQVGVVKGNGNYVVNRGPSDSIWLKASKKTTKAILDYAALAPVDGWTLCLEGSEDANEVKVTDAFICTADETVSTCDSKAKIASSKLF